MKGCFFRVNADRGVRRKVRTATEMQGRGKKNQDSLRGMLR